ncbi:RagB/SusD family nutrient uptake outer membrane protein [Zunongwangia sp. HGR-M22]|uniref:RagB/SusD family nutrient uptake outer membrane protein n=1 Tax=Zunongwangia sp. HGR-M22 TaxID=3015168 RepID=UPI0022DD5450|nr:RagB/SusD family nutrient uptake outer membrane protein [Zunongwangia sp. HGR-M22]WBL26573.1 RagB/SusD family nutrient uptake outer membrane protein [Zunongwangia sp. HGR-M22]
MKLNYIYTFLLIIVTTLVSCDDYVDIKTEGILYPEDTENYRYLLNNTPIYDLSYSLVDVPSDDISMRYDHAQYFEENAANSEFNRPFKDTYIFADSIYHTGEADSEIKTMYEGLYSANVVITEVLESTSGTEQEKIALRGEALVHRAYLFLNLVNTFGKAYDASTASTDLGIPIFTEPTSDGDIKRATVQQVYDQIISDLTEATNSGLPGVRSGTEVGFPSKSSAHALLARTYLYMGNYTEALENAEKSLALQNTLLDLKNYTQTPDFSWPRRIEDPELILSKTTIRSYAYLPTLLSLSDELLNSFDNTDLRYQLYTRSNEELSYGSISEGRSYCKARLTGENRNAGPTVPEMYLIKAECLARAGSTDAAMETINTLREARFRAEDYYDLSASDAEDALIKVLAERRRELMGKGGFRFFDLKRLNKEPRFAKTVEHEYLNETYTLEPGGDRYQFPFASTLFQYAPNLEQNP